uniref:Uncharacterized protein n=1 Tax=Tanacetum cinerariifolium TaxID=118510 RepID=A0A6L2M522_TANCI|nr:hypothetical protein [Tanacetum cinerariifolium]
MSHEEVAKQESDSDSDTDSRPSSTLEESSKQKPQKKFTYINEKGERFQMYQKEIENQKGIEQDVKADVSRSKIKKGKKDLIDIVGLDVVEKVYKDKVKYDKYRLKMLNRRAYGMITNYGVLSRGKGPISLKVYRDDGSDEIINTFKLVTCTLKNEER